MFQFRLTSPDIARVLLLTLTTILTVTSDPPYNDVNYQYLGPGYSYGYLQTPSTDIFFPTRSLLECALISLNSNIYFFSYNKVNHLCKNYSSNNIRIVVNNSVLDSNEMSFYRRSEWFKIYAISMGAGSKVYNSFTNVGDPSSWNVDNCIGIFCPNFFRHPFLDSWEKLPIDEVKLVIYKNQTSVVNMVFDARHSNYTNWFSYERLKSSPWKILPAEHSYFSLTGNALKRRIYIASEATCETDSGWLVIHEDDKMFCPWEESEHYPTIFYSERDSSVAWNDEHGVADSLAIFFRLRAK